MQKIFSWGAGKILEVEIPRWREWVPELINEFLEHQGAAEKSHKIKGRWENIYLAINHVPTARIPIRFARDIAQEILNISSIILFEPLPDSSTPYPPFWFNHAKTGESTGLHDHAHQSKISGVVYLSCSSNAGNLYFHKDGEVDLEIMPSVGKLVLFEPWMRHGVRENLSLENRLSLAFNLFPFPLPVTNL
ncbi:MAG: putative 2OG-Fe(II) oxygenase [Opitutae bacterium]